MANYPYPGVYIEEVSSGSRPIEAVGTSTAAFVGTAPLVDNRINELVWVNNWTEFCKAFVNVEGDLTLPASTPLSHAVYGFFLNGGSRCCVVNVGKEGSPISGGPTRIGLDLLEESDEIAIVAAPGRTGLADYNDILNHCMKLKNRFAILDAPQDVSDISLLTQVATAPMPASDKKPEEGEPKKSAKQVTGFRPPNSDSGYGAFYFPHLVVRDPLSTKPAAESNVVVAPSGHVAGIYARTDTTRGVHKAPANEAVFGALNVSKNLTRTEQGVLNPAGVNCIRFFPSEGIRVYGARTLAPAASDWRYVNVRRLLIMIEETISRNTRWSVFEPNDISLWKALRRDIRAFLTSLWREGALQGNSPEEAFFVKCDEETNPQDQIDLGRVFIHIGVAPVKPAEFVVFKIGQTAAGTESSS
jgi:uncharacterized protein